MRKLLTSVVLLSVVFLFAVPSAWAQEEDIATQIDATLNRMVDSDTFSGAVLIAQGGEIILSKGYGLADREWNIPNASDTKFRISELTRQFTAVATLLLQEQGLLSIEDPICQYLAECPESWQAITIHQLINSTSGIPDYVTLPDFKTTMSEKVGPNDLIERFIDKPLDFLPGTVWYESDSNYVLLGVIVDQLVSGSYARFLKDNLLEPLGMTNTGLDDTRKILEHRARGYESADRNADFMDMSVLYSAGGMYSTVEDLYIWNKALFAGEIVPLEVLDALRQNAVTVDFPYFGADPTYEVGVFSRLHEGHRVSQAYGYSDPGFYSFLNYYPDDDLVFIVLSNRADAASALWYFLDAAPLMFFEE